MKYPKHRTTVYNVVRTTWENTEELDVFHICDTFRTADRALEMVEVWKKEWLDKGFHNVLFEVMPSTYYDE